MRTPLRLVHSVKEKATHHHPQKRERALNQLRGYNTLAGLLHLTQAALVLLVANGFSLPVTTAFLRFNEDSGAVEPNLEQIGSLPLAPLIATFFLISAAAHLIVASFAFNWYTINLSRHINKARWWEYAASASLMMVLIALLAGVYDLGSLIMLFSLSAAMIGFGYLMELYNQNTRAVSWPPFTLGSLVGLVPWLVIGGYIVGAARSSGTELPGFVYAIVASLFLLFSSFAVNAYLQYRQIGPWRDYLFGEKAYIALSLLAKSALAWQVFAGTLR